MVLMTIPGAHLYVSEQGIPTELQGTSDVIGANVPVVAEEYEVKWTEINGARAVLVDDKAEIPMVKNTVKGMYVSTEGHSNIFEAIRHRDPYPSPSGGKRTRGNGDLEMLRAEYSIINSGWCNQTDISGVPGNQGLLGSAQVDMTTTVTAFIKNNGSTPITSFEVDYVVEDFFEEEIVNDTKNIASLAGGATTQVSFQFTPTWSSGEQVLIIDGSYNVYGAILNGYLINVTIDHSLDTDMDNNYWADYVFAPAWSDDAESGQGEWTGDISDTEWHRTDSALHQNNASHTPDYSWYCGKEGVASDRYEPDTDASLVSPKFDLSTFSEDHYVYAWFVFTGSANGDHAYLDMEYSEDGEDWNPILGPYGLPGESPYGQQNNAQTIQDWLVMSIIGGRSDGLYNYYYGWFIDQGLEDRSQVQFKMRFVSDSNPNPTHPGYYLDDFVVFGVEIPHDVKAKDVYGIGGPNEPGKEMNIKVEIGNGGFNTENDIDVWCAVEDEDGTELDNNTKQVSTLPVGGTDEVTFPFTPDAVGKYTVNAGVEHPDDIPEYNNVVYPISFYVREQTGNILIVDDDNSADTNGGGWSYNAEEDVMEALDELGEDYNVYQVLQDQTAPSSSMLSGYDLVLWATGSSYGFEVGSGNDVLTPEDEAALKSYLNNGNRLILFSQGLQYETFGIDEEANDFNEGTTPGTSFLRTHLHVESGDVNVNPDLITSIEGVGGPWEGNDFTVSVPDTLMNIPCTMQPMSDADAVFTATGGDNYTAVVYKGTYKTFYSSIPFGAVSSTVRTDYMELILASFLGGIEIIPGGTTSDAEPKEVIPFQFDLRNKGSEPDTVTFDIDAPTGYDVSLSTGEEVDVGGNEEITVTVNITVAGPADAHYGDTPEFNITATSAETGKTAYVLYTLDIQEYKEVKLTATSAAESGDPGDSVEFAVTVKNNGNNPDASGTITLSLDVTPNSAAAWAGMDQESLALMGQQSEDVAVTVAIPEDFAEAKAGEYEFTMLASMAGASAQPLPLIVTVNTIADVNISADPTEKSVDLSTMTSAQDNKSATFPVTVENKGNSDDNFTLNTVGLPNGWNAQFQEETVTVEAGSSADVNLEVFVPGNVNPPPGLGAYDFQVKAVSESDSTVTASFDLGLVVKRPDLEITGINVTNKKGNEKSKVEEGSTVTVTVVVENSGNADANIAVLLNVSGPKIEELGPESKSVPAGSEREFIFEWKTSKPGTYTITAIADSSDKAAEISEGNNEDSFADFKVEKKKPKDNPGFEALMVFAVVMMVVAMAAAGGWVRKRRH